MLLDQLSKVENGNILKPRPCCGPFNNMIITIAMAIIKCNNFAYPDKKWVNFPLVSPVGETEHTLLIIAVTNLIGPSSFFIFNYRLNLNAIIITRSIMFVYTLDLDLKATEMI